MYFYKISVLEAILFPWQWSW